MMEDDMKMMVDDLKRMEDKQEETGEPRSGHSVRLVSHQFNNFSGKAFICSLEEHDCLLSLSLT